MNEYNHSEHLHRFGCWAAAAAVRRGFTSNEKIIQAIESIKLRKQLIQLSGEDLSDESFTTHHKIWANGLIEELKKTVTTKEKVTYGRAAKIIAVSLLSGIIENHKRSSLIKTRVTADFRLCAI